LAVEVTGLTVDDEDVMPAVRGKGAETSVVFPLDAHGYADGGTPKGGFAEGKIAPLLVAAGAWLLPYLPEKPVRVGETWDLPLPYFLWSVKQPGIAVPEGFATQTLEAVEARAGVRCARIKTVAAIRRPQAKGLTPPDVGI